MNVPNWRSISDKAAFFGGFGGAFVHNQFTDFVNGATLGRLDGCGLNFPAFALTKESLSEFLDQLFHFQQRMSLWHRLPVELWYSHLVLRAKYPSAVTNRDFVTLSQ